MKVLLGVTGCIGAYKAAELLRQLQEHGAEVQVVMTDHACEFVRPLTFQSLSGMPVITGMFEPSDQTEIEHISIPQEVDLFLVAPATANCIAKFACGIADDFLTTAYLATTAPVIVAPAMNVEMWKHPATQANVERLAARGVHIVEPESGYLACGTIGEGRLAAVEKIAGVALEVLRAGKDSPSNSDFAGETVLVTAGPTVEPIDPVRFLSNRSSGKMGYAIARAARQRGARVLLISGPTKLCAPAGVERIQVQTTREMRDAVMANFEQASVIIKAAAVSDFRPAQVSEHKVKKDCGDFLLALEKTEDILQELGSIKGNRILAGFAAETENVQANAQSKLKAKNLDLIVANDLTREGAGFDVDTNAVTIFTAGGRHEEVALASKVEIAHRILDAVLSCKRSRLPASIPQGGTAERG